MSTVTGVVGLFRLLLEPAGTCQEKWLWPFQLAHLNEKVLERGLAGRWQGSMATASRGVWGRPLPHCDRRLDFGVRSNGVQSESVAGMSLLAHKTVKQHEDRLSEVGSV